MTKKKAEPQSARKLIAGFTGGGTSPNRARESAIPYPKDENEDVDTGATVSGDANDEAAAPEQLPVEPTLSAKDKALRTLSIVLFWVQIVLVLLLITGFVLFLADPDAVDDGLDKGRVTFISMVIGRYYDLFNNIVARVC